MPGIGKLVDDGSAPVLPWWKREALKTWKSVRQSVAVMALMQGPFYAFFGIVVFGAFVFSPPADMPPLHVINRVALGAVITYLGIRITRWGYRTVTVRHLNELSVIGFILCLGVGFIGWHQGLPFRDAVGVAALFLTLSAALFIVGRYKSEGGNS